MRVLAMDSSGLVASIAIVEDDILLAKYTLQYQKTHSQTLVPMLDEIRDMIELDLATIDCIAVAIGPGSFTGLRIGVATAKGLAGALNIPIVPVQTIEAMAYQLYGLQELICPIMDARRGQVYTGIYTFNRELELEVILEQTAISIKELQDIINQKKQSVLFLGDATPIYQEELKNTIQQRCHFAPAFCNRQCAGTIGTLGLHYYQQGKAQDYREVKPDYLRLSQAERERLERENES
ncbi:MAG: tRNA (adenosine(37)-N6)-threonylcarbamoyltransferase complex dimerization subunit type 1 TsaB [Eubacteriales bacterium]